MDIKTVVLALALVGSLILFEIEMFGIGFGGGLGHTGHRHAGSHSHRPHGVSECPHPGD